MVFHGIIGERGNAKNIHHVGQRTILEISLDAAHSCIGNVRIHHGKVNIAPGETEAVARQCLCGVHEFSLESDISANKNKYTERSAGKTLARKIASARSNFSPL